MKIKPNVLKSALILMASSFLCTGCVQEDGLDLAGGTMQFKIGKVSTSTSTRLTPSELGKPIAEKFKLKIESNSSGLVAYEGKFVPELDVRVGQYTITATCGEDVIIGRDTPYYIGTARAEVKKDQASSVTIPCKVGNALVSVRFGRNDEERQRFSRFYESFGLMVCVGNHSLAISEDRTSESIYFRAGSKPEFYFYGKQKFNDNRPISVPLSHEGLPETFQAAEHAQLTLTLPDPESALGVQIGKLEMTQVSLDETIPLSWLPIPNVTPEHQYTDGMLTGTDLKFTTSYPGLTWEAIVTNSSDEKVRSVKGTGALHSPYDSSADWPYLPAGIYKATYYIYNSKGASRTGSREFRISQPKLQGKVEGYTSYDKYKEQDIAAANACNGHTLYAPSVSVNISAALTAIAHYGYKMDYALEGDVQSSQQNTQNLKEMTLDAREAPYVLDLKATFAGETITAVREFFITGIPFMSEPPTTQTWDTQGQDITDEDGYACMGGFTFATGSSTMNYRKVAIPAGTNLTADYKFINSNGVETTNTTIRAEQQLIVEQKGERYKDITVDETRDITLETFTSKIEVHNSHDAGASNTDVYRVGLRYR